MRSNSELISFGNRKAVRTDAISSTGCAPRRSSASRRPEKPRLPVHANHRRRRDLHDVRNSVRRAAIPSARATIPSGTQGGSGARCPNPRRRPSIRRLTSTLPWPAAKPKSLLQRATKRREKGGPIATGAIPHEVARAEKQIARPIDSSICAWRCGRRRRPNSAGCSASKERRDQIRTVAGI